MTFSKCEDMKSSLKSDMGHLPMVVVINSIVNLEQDLIGSASLNGSRTDSEKA